MRVEGGGHGASTRDMWRHMSLVEINTALATPLTRDEVMFNLQSSPDLSVLPRYSVNFVPGALGSGTQVIQLELGNPGFLTTSFSIHLPNERDIELEPWADEGASYMTCRAISMALHDVTYRARAVGRRGYAMHDMSWHCMPSHGIT